MSEAEYGEPWKTIACYDSSGYPFIMINGIQKGELIDAADKRAKRAELCVNTLAGLSNDQVQELAKWDLGKVLEFMNTLAERRCRWDGRTITVFDTDRGPCDCWECQVQRCRREQA